MKKMIIGIVIGITITLIGGFIVAKAATSITSTQVLYSNANTSATTVKAAIDELMTKSKSATATAYEIGWVSRSSAGQVATATYNLSSYLTDISKGEINKNIFIVSTRVGLYYTTAYGYNGGSGGEAFVSATYNNTNGNLTITITGSGCDWTKVRPQAYIVAYIIN